MVLSFRAEMEHPGNSVGPIFCFITYESNQGSCMLIVARGNPRLLALTDSPVKLVASVIRVWWGGGREYYPVKQPWCYSSKKLKSIPRRYSNLASSAWKKFIFR